MDKIWSDYYTTGYTIGEKNTKLLLENKESKSYNVTFPKEKSEWHSAKKGFNDGYRQARSDVLAGTQIKPYDCYIPIWGVIT